MKYKLTANRLKIALSNNNMTSQELSDRSGVSKASISQYINGSHAPSNISSGKMGSVLDVNPLWLMGFDVEMHSELSASFDLSHIEKEIIKSYRTSDEIDRQMVRRILHVDEIDTAELKAAHVRTDIRPTAAGKAHDDAIMDNDNEWK